ncbi:biopolymer transporter ExbD [candidate division KSB1 bacterium]|nr:biopolymer transporter ExbD [candidate division KSB1 bacterium]
MRINLDDNHIIGIEMGPLIDCVFLLLIFFLVATTLKKPDEAQQPLQVEEQAQEEIIEEININLPEPAISAGPATETGPLVIAIDEKGQFFLGGSAIGIREMHSQLRKYSSADPNRHIRIDVDRYSDSQYLIQLLDLCAYEGLTNYGIHTQTKID